MSNDLKSIRKNIAISGIAQVAVSEVLAANLGLRNFEQIKVNIAVREAADQALKRGGALVFYGD
jgi:hypothetical protein